MTKVTGVSSRTRLTARQEAFSVNWFRLRDAGRASVAAGYAPLYAAQNADKLLKNTKIAQRIAELEAKVESDAIGTVIERKQRLTDIYRANLTDFLDEKGQVKLSKDIPHHGAVSEYSVKTIGEGEDGMVLQKTLKLRDPIAAIQEQNRMERIGADTTPSPAPGSQVLNIIVVGGSDNLKDVLDQVKERTKKLAIGEN